ncbi:MAG: cysteine--tRNA ligase [Polyangiaceae bacterium]|nr:cysteine--tRNA ligase [Polyangiaceae bacterium]
MTLRVYSSLSRSIEAVVPREPGHVRVYCCGPTTYDVSHAGHGRSACLPDVLVRHLRATGHRVTYVRNVTDVEDKILKRAKERGEEPLALSERFAAMYDEDLEALSCLRPEAAPRVSQTIPEIVAMVERLVAAGHAYVVDAESGKDVWYSVRSFSRYGKLSGRAVDELRTGEGLVDRGKSAHADKRDPLDFALWKSAPPGEWSFDSPWGKGRPGWHIECSAMVEKHLGFGIDVHCGGMDLVFPHHENEIAQSEAASPGCGAFATIWLHNGFLNVDKEKMAKSLGNFVTMRDCFARNDPDALRLLYLSAHYRGPIEFETEKLPDGRVIFPGLDEHEARLDYLYQTKARVAALAARDAEGDAKELTELRKLVRGARDRVTKALDDDLNTPVALSVVGELAKAINDLCDLADRRKKDAKLVAAAAGLAREAQTALSSSAAVLGVLQSDPGAYADRCRARRLALRGLDAAAIDAKIAERRAARDAKDFSRADAVRDELVAMGVELFDTPDGTTWRLPMRAPRAAG